MYKECVKIKQSQSFCVRIARVKMLNPALKSYLYYLEVTGKKNDQYLSGF